MSENFGGAGIWATADFNDDGMVNAWISTRSPPSSARRRSPRRPRPGSPGPPSPPALPRMCAAAALAVRRRRSVSTAQAGWRRFFSYGHPRTFQTCRFRNEHRSRRRSCRWIRASLHRLTLSPCHLVTLSFFESIHVLNQGTSVLNARADSPYELGHCYRPRRRLTRLPKSSFLWDKVCIQGGKASEPRSLIGRTETDGDQKTSRFLTSRPQRLAGPGDEDENYSRAVRGMN